MPPPESVSNSVVYTSKCDAGGSVSSEIVTGLLDQRIYGIGGGDAGICGLSDSGVYEFDGERLCDSPYDDIAVGGHHLVGIEPGSGGNSGESSLYSWGTGEFGELGLGPMTTHTSTPSKINYKGNFVQVDSSLNHSLAVDSHGNVFAWGQNFEKQLGLYTKNITDMKEIRETSETEDVLFTPRFIPMSLGKPVLKVACGHSFSAVVTKSGDIWTWGAGESGQLGSGRCTFRELPTKVNMESRNAEASRSDSASGRRALSTRDSQGKLTSAFDDIACGAAHVIARRSDGSCYGWGMNKFGQLGVGDTNTRFSPTLVALQVTEDENKVKPSGKESGRVIKRIYAYSNCSAGIDAYGLLYTWGSSQVGRLMRSGKTKSITETASFNDHYACEFTDAKEAKIRNYARFGEDGLNRNHSVDPSEWGLASSEVDGNDVGAGKGEMKFSGMTTYANDIKSLRASAPSPNRESVDNASSDSLLKGRRDEASSQNMPNFYTTPEIVTLFGDQTISSFAFARNQSAVLIKTRVSALNPAMGPMKNFSRLVIFGEGFWDSDKIVVKFTPEDGEAPPRSTTGKLYSGRELFCRPPKLQEPGIYTVSVSMDGKNFLSQTLAVRIYKEMTVDKISPSLIDLRSPTTTNVTMALKNLRIYAQDEADHDGNPMWPCESDLDDKFKVKLHVSCSAPGSLEPASTEVIVSAALKPLPILEYDTLISGQNSVVSTKSKNNIDENGAVAEFKADLDYKPEEGSTTSISVTNAFVDREVICDVDFTSLGPIGSLIMIRGAVSINGQDFSAPSSESSPIICHSFSPSGCDPCCRPMHTFSLRSNDRPSGGMVGMDRTVTVFGSSFIPLDKLPSGLTIEALIRGSFNIGAGGKSKKERSIEKIVPVSCLAANRLTFLVPTLDQLLSPGTHVASDGDADSSDETIRKSVAAAETNTKELSLEVFFQLVNTAAVTTATTSRVGSKTKSSSPKKASSPSKSSGKASRGKKDSTQHPFLSDLAVKILLYSSQPITVSPRILNRLGGSSSTFTIQGAGEGGFNFSSPNVRVVLYRDDLNLHFTVPSANLKMFPVNMSEVIDDSVSSWLSIHPDDESKETSPDVIDGVAGGSVATNIGQPNMILIKHMPPLFMPEGSAFLPSSDSVEPSPNATTEKGDDLVEETDVDVEKGDAEGDDKDDGDGGAGDEENYGENAQQPIPLDFVHVKVQLDGETDVETSEHLATLITYTNLHLSEEMIEVPKGGAIEGSLVHLAVLAACVPSNQCVVRLRDSCGKFVDCIGAEVAVEGELATPASIAIFASDNGPTLDAGSTDQEVTGAVPPKSEESADGSIEGDEQQDPASAEVPDDGEDAAVEASPEGKLDTGGLPGTISFECPNFTSLEPVVDGKDMLLFVDVSLDDGASFDKALKPLLQVKM